jgi:hypothetical protein
MMLSRTVASPESPMFWNERPIPSRVTWCGRIEVNASPFQWTDPRFGRYTPDSTLSSEDLPAPFGPMTE